MHTVKNIAILVVAILFAACGNSHGQQSGDKPASESGSSAVKKVVKTDAEWKAQLTKEEYQVTRKAGTETAFTGEYYDFKGHGNYNCRCCGHPLFDSEHKYNSGTGWPSFYKPLGDTSLLEHTDNAYGWSRTEVVCAKCDAHLGHVFNDGPEPTGLRYCINSVSIKFEEKK